MEKNFKRLESPLISILMPTYNKEKYIKESITSILNQTYTNFEIIIIDDGSTDNTEEIVNSISDHRLVYIKQENQDQLNAVINGYRKSKGEIFALIHSDDLLYNENVFEKNISILREDEIDGLYFDFVIIDEFSNEINQILKSPKNFKKSTIPNLLLNYGANDYKDHFFIKKKAFEKFVMNNYLYWNTPYWLPVENEMIKLKKMNYYYYKYRVFNGNYKESDIGKFCLLNGIYRTILKVSDQYSIPIYPLQYFLYRFLKKVFRFEMSSIYTQKKTKNIYIILEKIYNKIYNKQIEKKIFYFSSIINFYKKNSIIRKIEIEDYEFDDIKIFYGKDMRTFYKEYSNNDKNDIYTKLLTECDVGFNEIILNSIENIEKMKIILKFLNIECKINLK